MSITLLDIYSISTKDMDYLRLPYVPDSTFANGRFLDRFCCTSGPIDSNEHIAFLLY